MIEDYNNFVINKIKFVSEKLDIDINRYKPKDCKGIEHMLGVFDADGHYEKFITRTELKNTHIISIKRMKI